jgi:putative DNA primase/helicase
MDGDKEMSQFMQRLLGYCLSGLTTERIFPILYGQDGQNGKGTLLETLKKILGKLAGSIPAETLLQSRFDNTGAQARPDLMQLRGKRLAWCSETNKGKVLDVAKVKWLSGGDTIVARHLHQNLVEFEPTAKLFLLTNHQPKVDGGDSALFYRLLMIPFMLSFVPNPTLPHERKRDEGLQDKMIAEASGILAWLYQGFRMWRQHGLNPPNKVLLATRDFKNDNDTISQFLSDACLIMPGVRVKPTELYKKYKSFCDELSLEAEKEQSFFGTMKRRFKQEKNKRGRWYVGICLPADETPATE